MKTVQFLDKDYFAVGLINSNERKRGQAKSRATEFIIYKTSDGVPFCRFKLKQDLDDDTEFEFLKNNTSPNAWACSYTGILDKRTRVIYDLNLLTLLHLGAT